MKALISEDGRVVDLCAVAFPVHPAMRWITAPPDVTREHRYVDGEFIAPTTEALTFEQRRARAYNDNGVTVQAICEAMIEKESGNSSKLNALIAKRNKVRGEVK